MKTQVNLAGILMKNPVMTASGTFGYGREYCQFFDLNILGALVTKAVTLKLREGNPQPRICEVTSGMLNSIGLQNPGREYFIEEAVPFLEKLDIPVIVNISENTIEDFAEVTRILSSVKRVSALEVNVSCPNIKVGGMLFGTDPKATYEVVRAVRQSTELPIIAKLSPNVTSIVPIARAAYEAGANALSMINTVLGMSVDVETRKPRIHGNKTYMGGLSGPSIKPIGVRCVHQVYRSGIPLPIVGMGGITNAADALEYIIVGATAVAVGTATFDNPLACKEVITGIEDYMRRHKIEDINELRGSLKELD